MASVALPAPLQDQLDDLAGHMKFWRTLRGVGLFLLVMLFAAVVAIGLDALVGLPRIARTGLFGAWIALGVMFGWAKLIRPSLAPADTTALALAVEQQYPKLAERLSTTVEVTSDVHPGHGSPQLINMLARETEQRAKKLDFLRAVQTGPTTFVICAAILSMFGAGVALAVVPGAGEHTRRFLLPWYSPATELGFHLVVSSGDPAIRKGDSVTLSAYLEPTIQQPKLPKTVFLIARNSQGKEERLAMSSEQDLVYTLRRGPVQEDFEYRVEAGDAESELHRVTAVTPVELGSESSIAVNPPAYALNLVEATPPAIGFVDVAAWQYGTVTFQLQLNRKPVNAWLEWLPSGAGGAVQKLPLIVDESFTATHVLSAEQTGTMKLVLDAEHGIRTELPPLNVTVRIDAAPRFVEVTGVSDQTRNIRSTDAVPITFNVVDDIAISKLEIEYRVNNGQIQTIAVPGKGIGSTQVGGSYPFTIPNVKEGDLIEYRLKATDNRDVPTFKLSPQVTYFPADNKWSELKVAQKAEPLKEQEIVAQRDQIKDQLNDIIRNLKSDSRAIEKLKSQPPLDIEAARDLKATRDRVGEASRQLEQLARDIGTTPELRNLADQLQQVADQRLKQANDALRNAEAQREMEKRNPLLKQADAQVNQAIDKLEALNKENDRIAQERMDRQQLERLALEQQQLAEQAKKADPNELDALKEKQKEIANELERLMEKSPELREALEAQRAEQARQAANEARDLAQDQRDLAQAMKQNDQLSKQERVADILKKQQDLAKEMQKLAQNSEPSVRAAQARPLDPMSALEAEKALDQGEMTEALKKQERAAFELERLAADLERAVKNAADPREAARQLARLQDDLRQRMSQATRDKKLADLPKEQLDRFRAEQEAIRRGAEALSIPPNDQQSQNARRNASDFAQKANDNLERNNQAIAEANMLQSRDSLNRLAELMPTQEQRAANARRELANLKQQQNTINQQAEAIAKEFAQKDPDNATVKKEITDRLAELAKKQANVAEKLATLDTPNQEARRERTLDAMRDGLNDLLDGKAQDIPASQQEARRQLERLEQALSGQRPVDEQAAELARKQGDVSKEVAKAVNLPAVERDPKLNDLRRQQADIAKQANALQAPEAPQQQADAADATNQAAKERLTPEEFAQRTQQAREALERLSEQLNGKESTPDRADRLAKKTKASAQQAEQRGEEKPNPAQAMMDRQKLQQLQEEAKQLRADDAQKEKQKAVQALDRAERLAQQNAPQPQQAQARREAGDAMQRLADKIKGEETPAQEAQNLARDQRDLQQQANNPKTDPQQAAQRQQELAERADKLAKKTPQAQQAAEQMKQAQQKLQQAQNPMEAREQLQRAADATDQLAKELNRDPMPMANGEQPKSPEQQARDLAQKQRDLAKATNQAQQQADPNARKQAMNRVAEQQKELNKQASELPAERTPQALQQAREAMNRAEQSLEKQDGASAQRQQNEAAQALEQMGQQSAQRKEPNANAQQAQPGREQAQQARDLAKQQRDLRDEVLRAMNDQNQANRPMPMPMPMGNPQQNPIADLAKEQQNIAKQANDLAKSIGQDKGQQSPQGQQSQQAAQSAQRASEQMENGALPQAKESGQMASQRLQQLAQSSDGPNADKARQLAQRQEELNKKIDPVAQNGQAARQQQQLRQQDLQQQVEQLSQELGKMNQQKGMRNPHVEEAQQEAQRARELMQQAQRQMENNQPNNAQQSREQAAQALERSSQEAQQAANQMAKGQPMPMNGQPMNGQPMANGQPMPNGQPMNGQPMNGQPMPGTGEALRQAQNEMRQAQQQLNQGQPMGAQPRMEQAAQRLNQASQQMSQSQPKGPSNGGQNANAGQGMPDLTQFGPDAAKYAGKSWGELPGELKTKIIQDMKARYGDDYAKVIKYYFEQLADRK